MARGIFLINTDNALTELREAPYDSEALLQQLLADHPSILAGEEDDNGAARRWLLITREASVPDTPDGGGRWSVRAGHAWRGGGEGSPNAIGLWDCARAIGQCLLDGDATALSLLKDDRPATCTRGG